MFIYFIFFPFQKNDNLYSNYSLFELIELIILYLILFVCVGGGSLLIFQKFMSITIKYFKRIHENSAEIISSYINVILTSLSMLIKIILNYKIIKQFDYFNSKKKIFNLYYNDLYYSFCDFFFSSIYFWLL